MSWGEIAGLIVAISFAVLVVFLVVNLKKFSELLVDLRGTAKEVNHSLSVVTKDVDNLSLEVESLLNKTNYLMDDLNKKLAKTDPLFRAIGDVGQSVSDVNQSSRNLAASLAPKKEKQAKVANKAKLSRAAEAFKRIRNQRQEAGQTNQVQSETKKDSESVR
ncbi:DUF948 domain-containing protein [Atopobacter sp. AH10]|uniref:DUF948 domain-containing protein n=1 Tax=Atopobacter sp. AH10 TaxID=2315861 RepID=UPI000EF1E10E|nr:DUF948 domain-containing protein [Atopobacter sp. AH10]RLK63968.1 DUF948 domain-containing protein [Atopobacter sp. AH10]